MKKARSAHDPANFQWSFCELQREFIEIGLRHSISNLQRCKMKHSKHRHQNAAFAAFSIIFRPFDGL